MLLAMRLALPVLLVAAATCGVSLAVQPTPAGPQWNWPARMANAKVLRPDTPPDRLRDIMRDFTRTIGVRCSFCHVGREGQPLATYDFASDANPHKEVARGMIRMVTRLNREILPEALRPDQADPEQPLITCYSCHRGFPHPALAPPEGAPGTPPPAAAPAPAPPKQAGH